MKANRRRASSILASVLLGTITIAVFATNSEGPASVVERFHQAIIQRNGALAQECVLQRLDDYSAMQMTNLVTSVLLTTRNYEVVKTGPGPRGSFLVDVTYEPGRANPRLGISWVVVSTPRGLKIDTNATLFLMRGALEPR